MITNFGDNTDRLITPGHLRRLAIVYIRQSTERQVLQNTGSTELQRGLVKIARSYGWPDSQIKIIDEDLGRSGSSTEGRTGWQTLQDMIDADQVGAVFVWNVSRLSRQVLDFEVFRMRTALHDTLLYSDGRLGNPANADDALLAQTMAMVAQFENRKRTEIMMQSKMSKAKRGEVISRLPVGWIKTTDGSYEFDPETEEIIRKIIDNFWKTRSLGRTVKELAKAGVLLPCRRRHGQLCLKKPTLTRVKFILTHPAYTGTYIFAKTQSDPGARAAGRSKTIKLPHERWIKTVDHHPRYMTAEEQEEIKSILTRNQYKRRRRVARSRAAIQGLLRCGRCGSSVLVQYPSKSVIMYTCRRLRDYAEKPCMIFGTNELDEYILGEVFQLLKAPSVEMLKSALEASRNKKQTGLSRIEAERKRLVHEESVARERADLARGSLSSVYFDALQQLDRVLEEKRAFEQQLALRPAAPADDTSEEELEELCRIASDVPSLWRHEAVTHQERRAILSCLIDHIVVAPTKERIEATIVWNSGAQSTVFFWRARRRHHLIRELHSQQLTVSEIRAHLAAGKTSTGQSINISEGGIRISLNRMGLKPARYSLSRLSVRQKAAELDREGQSLDSIARYFNEQGYATPSGMPWTRYMVEHLLRANGQKQEPLEKIHRKAIEDGRAHGLTDQQMADEFNSKNLRRRGGLQWTAKSVAVRWRDLKRVHVKREQNEKTESIVLKRSA